MISHSVVERMRGPTEWIIRSSIVVEGIVRLSHQPDRQKLPLGPLNFARLMLGSKQKLAAVIQDRFPVLGDVPRKYSRSGDASPLKAAHILSDAPKGMRRCLKM